MRTNNGIRTITQTQISAFERCERFYFLKYIRNLVWPVEIVDRQRVRDGDDFHLLLRQLLLGFPKETLIFPSENPNVRRWIDTFLRKKPVGSADRVFAEKEVSCLFENVLFLGKFDALAIQDDRLTIFDWKTGMGSPDTAQYLRAPQTRLYRFLAKSCAPRLLEQPDTEIPAENIEMVYWFPEHPDRTIRLRYTKGAWEEDKTWLRTRVRQMLSENEQDYSVTEKTRRCGQCIYRTWCFPDIYTGLSEPEEIPVPDQEEDIPPEIFQPGFFFPDDTDREDTTY
ncbi:MAG: PD-(D/E)XK nuclease family protein [Anaerolineaceae bacterium]|nr:PD-(D/E)XK nuclease family protein [Anaerolineaceae bacterium]